MKIICIQCERYNTKRATRERLLKINGITVRVPNDEFMKCNDCGAEYYTSAQYKRADERVQIAKKLAQI